MLKEIFKNTEEAMINFGKYVVQQSRSRLSKSGSKKGKLYKSIDYALEIMPNSFLLRFPFMKDIDYAKFIDQGVKGTKSNYLQNRNTPFKYKNKMPPVKVFDKWSIKQGIAPRSKQGKFKSRQSLKFALAKSIYQKGIPAKFFFTKSFDMGYKNLPNQVIEAFGLDVKERFKEFTIK